MIRTLPSARSIALVLALGVIACGAGSRWLAAAHADDKAAPAGPPPILEHVGTQIVIGEGSPLRRSLAVQAIAEETVQPSFELPADVEADPARLVKVLPPAAGRIVSLDKRLGDSVRRGDVLFRIAAPDLAQARSDAQKAEAAEQLAQRALDRQRALGTSEIAAQRDVEQAEADASQARSETARAAARLAQMGSADGTTLVVRAPIAGRVVDLGAGLGAYWNDPTAALMTIADLSTIVVSASAAETDLANLHVGQAARIVLDAYPGETLEGRVHDIADLLDTDTRRVKVRLAFDNHDGRLKPGMYAKATFAARARRGLLVPVTAVVQNGLAARVYVERQPWHFEPQVVQLGTRIGDRLEIVSGLAAGERIVVKDGVLLDD